MDRFQAMQVFVTILDTGSLTAAAESLGKSLPTVVRTLSNLEQSLGARLLTRTTRRIALTEEGRRYLEHCRRILAHVDEAEAELTDQRSEAAGHLTVTAPVLFGQMHVVPGISSFLAHHSQARVDMLLLDRVVDLIDEGVDLAVRIAHLTDSSMIARRVGHIRRVLCASPDYLAQAGIPATPHELSHFECVRWRTQEGGNLWRFRDPNASSGRSHLLNVHPQGRFTSNHVAGAINACAAGLGIGSFLSYQVESLVAQGKLLVLLTEFEQPAIPVSLTHSHTRLVPNRVRTLIDWLADDLGQRLSSQTLT
jgi:DNA-binding transcriptional LysR family regulator